MHHKPRGSEIVSSNSGKRFFAKTENQDIARKKFFANDILCLTGPAGSGKSYISILLAAKMLKEGRIKKILLMRPAVAAGGEDLGFLPGEIENKMDPYLQPMYDILKEVFDEKKDKKKKQKPNEKGKQPKSKQKPTKEQVGPKTTIDFSEFIEILPVAYARGHSFKNCVVLCDESENLTKSQMHLILTRIGENSKMIFNGDLKQSDIPGRSGYEYFLDKIAVNPIQGIDSVAFSEEDIVRHPLIGKIDRLFHS